MLKMTIMMGLMLLAALLASFMSVLVPIGMAVVVMTTGPPSMMLRALPLLRQFEMTATKPILWLNGLVRCTGQGAGMVFDNIKLHCAGETLNLRWHPLLA